MRPRRSFLFGIVGAALAVSRSGSVDPAPTSALSSATVESRGGDDAERASEAPTSRSFNVLLITVDTLRWDLGFMGYPRPITPNLDALAERSTVFERAYATASYTPKSIGPMLIGRYASETFRDGQHYTTFYPANVFVAERLRSAGHRTLAAGTHQDPDQGGAAFRRPVTCRSAR